MNGVTNRVYGDYADPDDWGSGGGPVRRRFRGRLGSDRRGDADAQRRVMGDCHGARLRGRDSRIGHDSSGHGADRRHLYCRWSRWWWPGGGVRGGHVGVRHYTDRHQRGLGGRAGTVYLRDTDESYGSLIIANQYATEAGWTPLGMPGQDTLTIPDELIIRDGTNTQVKVEHPGLVVEVERGVRIEGGAQFSASGESFVPRAEVLVSGGGRLELTGTATFAGPLTVTGNNSQAALERLVAPAVSVLSSGLVTTSPPRRPRCTSWSWR